ncbi:MAG: aspartate aminotransferase family protein [Phycisphaerae bacterium]
MGNQAQIVEQTKAHIIENYGRLPIAMARGAGSHIWDADGKEYLDFFAGFGGAGVCGHCHPQVVRAVQHQAETLMCHGNLFTSEPQVELAKAITSHGFGGKVFFCHSGAEANEAAIKLVRKAAGEGRYKIISFENCFHGRTMGGLSITPKNFQAGFEPMLPGGVMVPYGDLDAVAAAIDSETAGVFVEPIQGEGGMNMPPADFLPGLRRLCDENNLVLVADEVWTAPARTGKWYAHQHFGFEPDVMTLAKALGGGAPIAACVASEKYADVLTPGTHGCTMGGNPLCAAAGAATMKLIEAENLTDRAAQKGDWVVQALRDADVPCVEEVRGKGLMIGVAIDESAATAKDIMMKCMEHGLMVCVAKQNVLRLAPPLTTPDEDFEKALQILMRVLKEI